MLAGICLVVLVPSCPIGGQHDCTEIGCSSQLAISLRPADGQWADGRYELFVHGDLEPATCSFDIPADIPPLGSVNELDCTGPIQLGLQQDAKCIEPPGSARVNPPCTLIAGQFVVLGAIDRTPKSLMVRVARDGETLLTKTVRPAYEQSRPNGPDCSPVCDHAEEDFTF